LALALLISFCTETTMTYAGDPAPAPTEENRNRRSRRAESE